MQLIQKLVPLKRPASTSSSIVYESASLLQSLSQTYQFDFRIVQSIWDEARIALERQVEAATADHEADEEAEIRQRVSRGA